MPGAAFRIPGTDSEEAWRGLAHRLGDLRLFQALEQAGWAIVEEVIDQTTFVLARDPDGVVWAIGAASRGGDRRGYLERDIELDGRSERIAFVEPLDSRSVHALMSVLRAAN